MKFNDNDLKSKKLSLIKSETTSKCSICGQSTQYIDYCYETRVCSTECLSELDKQVMDFCSKYEE